MENFPESEGDAMRKFTVDEMMAFCPCYTREYAVQLADDCEALQQEIAMLRNDLADALDLKNGVGPTVLTALATDRDRLHILLAGRNAAVDALQQQIAQVTEELDRARQLAREWHRESGICGCDDEVGDKCVDAEEIASWPVK